MCLLSLNNPQPPLQVGRLSRAKGLTEPQYMALSQSGEIEERCDTTRVHLHLHIQYYDSMVAISSIDFLAVPIDIVLSQGIPEPRVTLNDPLSLLSLAIRKPEPESQGQND